MGSPSGESADPLEEVIKVLDPREEFAGTIMLAVSEDALFRDILDKLNIRENFRNQVIFGNQDKQGRFIIKGRRVDSIIKIIRENNDYKDVLNELKNKLNIIKNIRCDQNGDRECDRECRKKKNTASTLFDTCYYERKAERFCNGLKAILERINDNESRFKLLVLLLHTLTGVIRDYTKYDSIEWFLHMLNRVASSNNGFFPVCPWRGDALALLYAVLFALKKNTSGRASICGVSIRVPATGSITISRDDIRSIVLSLSSLQ